MWCTSPHSSRLPARSVRFVFGPFLATLSAALFALLSSSLSLFMAAWPLPFFFLHFLFCLSSPFVLYSRFSCYFFQSLFELWIFGFETLKVALQFKMHLRQYFSNNNHLLSLNSSEMRTDLSFNSSACSTFQRSVCYNTQLFALIAQRSLPQVSGNAFVQVFPPSSETAWLLRCVSLKVQQCTEQEAKTQWRCFSWEIAVEG